MNTKGDRRTYRRGRLIKDLAVLMRQDFIFYVHNPRPINRGWFKSWKLHYAQSLIELRQLFRAVKKGGAK